VRVRVRVRVHVHTCVHVCTNSILSLSSLQVLQDKERKLLADDPDDEQLLSLVQDSTGRRNSRYEHAILKAQEDVKNAEKQEVQAKENLANAKELVSNFVLICISSFHK